MSDQQVLRSLSKLYRIVEAGEKGFATAAANTSNPALKIYFKLCAQQRFTFKHELFDEMQRLGAHARPESSILGAIHRGRVAIFAGLAEKDGQAKVVLKEAAIGEKVAERSYASVLARELPAETRALVERQFAEVCRTGEQVRCLRDDAQRRTAMRVTGDDQDQRQAIQALINEGIDPGEIETMALNEQVLYQGRGATLSETVLSGAFGGALWGGITGMAAGIGVVQTTHPAGTEAILVTWLLAVLAFMAIGALISSVLALFIGFGISGEDKYQYQAITENARTLILARMCPAESVR